MPTNPVSLRTLASVTPAVQRVDGYTEHLGQVADGEQSLDIVWHCRISLLRSCPCRCRLMAADSENLSASCSLKAVLMLLRSR